MMRVRLSSTQRFRGPHGLKIFGQNKWKERGWASPPRRNSGNRVTEENDNKRSQANSARSGAGSNTFPMDAPVKTKKP